MGKEGLKPLVNEMFREAIKQAYERILFPLSNESTEEDFARYGVFILGFEAGYLHATQLHHEKKDSSDIKKRLYCSCGFRGEWGDVFKPKCPDCGNGLRIENNLSEPGKDLTIKE